MLSDNDQSWQFRGRADPWHERILRPPTFVNSNYAPATVGGQARHSKSRKTLCAKSGPVVKSPLPDKDCHSAFVVPHDRSCAIELIRRFHASFTFSRPGLLRSQLMIGEHLSLLIAMAGANMGCYLWGEIILRHYPFLFSIDADEPKLLGAKHWWIVEHCKSLPDKIFPKKRITSHNYSTPG